MNSVQQCGETLPFRTMLMSNPQSCRAGTIWTFQSPLWQTNSVLVVDADGALLVDPAYFPAEIAAIRAETERQAAGSQFILLTHADFDHTCGIPSFPAAEVIAGPDTRAQIESGAAGRALAGQGQEWGADWPTQLRVDRVVGPGEEVACGPFRVATIEARGHVGDGLAFVLLEQGLLAPGDYLSASTYPYAVHSVAEARETTQRLLVALAEHAIDWVVPGHGPVLDADRARQIAREDIGYLERLEERARDAAARSLPPGPALLHVYAVEPPRPNTDDFEVYGIRAANAARALEEFAPVAA
jgi:hydroxyacylglutathione hydrolase